MSQGLEYLYDQWELNWPALAVRWLSWVQNFADFTILLHLIHCWIFGQRKWLADDNYLSSHQRIKELKWIYEYEWWRSKNFINADFCSWFIMILMTNLYKWNYISLEVRKIKFTRNIVFLVFYVTLLSIHTSTYLKSSKYFELYKVYICCVNFYPLENQSLTPCNIFIHIE